MPERGVTGTRGVRSRDERRGMVRGLYFCLFRAGLVKNVLELGLGNGRSETPQTQTPHLQIKYS